MITQPPRRNLPPDAEAWGRWAEQAIINANQGSLESSQITANSLAAINGSLALISQQITQLQSTPGVLSGSLTTIGPVAAAPTPTETIISTNYRPSWANKATVILTNDTRIIGDPAVMDATSSFYIRLLSPNVTNSTNYAGATVSVSGDSTRRGSATATYSFDRTALGNAEAVRIVLSVSRSDIPASRSIDYRCGGLVFWNA